MWIIKYDLGGGGRETMAPRRHEAISTKSRKEKMNLEFFSQ
jgi:hypothetical protein